VRVDGTPLKYVNQAQMYSHPVYMVPVMFVNDKVLSVCLVFINHPCPKMGAAASGTVIVFFFVFFVNDKVLCMYERLYV
jgi:hypothetical protein